MSENSIRIKGARRIILVPQYLKNQIKSLSLLKLKQIYIKITYKYLLNNIFNLKKGEKNGK